ncbi:MAG: RDD family protein, partial [Bacteroidia bacterium]|nr:RDD family protein [Bacteroidia bacterium]
ISESIFYLGFVWAALNPKRETWHDRVANTLVVNAN